MVGGLLLRLNLALFFGVSLLGSRGFVLLGNALWNLLAPSEPLDPSSAAGTCNF